MASTYSRKTPPPIKIQSRVRERRSGMRKV
jgi:hypothetical protein